MKTPPYLKKEDTIGIVATARKVSLEEVQPTVDLLKSWGLNTKFGGNLFNDENQFAGFDEERAADLQSMIDDDSVQAILCARGGYGTVRIIDKVDFSRFSKNPKWIIGYSDVTVIHSHIHSLYGIETLHGTMPLDITGTETEATLSLKKALFGEEINYTIPSYPLNRIGNASGILVGGNLSILYSLMGSVSDIDTDNKILFIEDLDEYLYHIDRMMTNLKRAGKFDKLKGLVVGGMTDMRDNAIPFGKSPAEIIMDAVKEYDFPVCFDFPAGHLKSKNHALFLGRKAELNISPEKTSLNFSIK